MGGPCERATIRSKVSIQQHGPVHIAACFAHPERRATQRTRTPPRAPQVMLSDVVIAGAGTCGLFAALALRELADPPRVAIYESRTEAAALAGVGGIMIQENGIAAIRALKKRGPALHAAIVEAGAPIGSGGFLTRDSDTIYYSDPVTRSHIHEHRGVAIQRAALQRILQQAVLAASVHVYWETPIVDVETKCLAISDDGADDGTQKCELVQVTLPDGTTRSCELLIGADGINSTVRAKCGTKRNRTSAKEDSKLCWIGTADQAVCENSKEKDAAHYSSAEFWGYNGSRFGFFPAGKGMMCWYAFARKEDVRMERYDTQTRTFQKGEELVGLFKDFPKVCETILRSSPNSLAVSLRERGPSGRKWCSGAVTLIGDAAHAMLPSLGMGANVGLEDVVELVCLLDEGLDVPNACRTYERRRTARVRRFLRTARRVDRLGSIRGRRLCLLRNTMLRCTPTGRAEASFRWMYDQFVPRSISAK